MGLSFRKLALSWVIAASFQARAQERITAESVYKLVQDAQIQSVDDLVVRLPEALRKNFSLVYATRNQLQGASEDRPRVILFSSDGGFQMTFTGDSLQKGGDSVEMITQNSSGNYEFSRIVFKEGQKALKQEGAENCLQCHGAKARPIWDYYPQWPAVYGSHHDKLKDSRIPGADEQRNREEDAAFLRNSLEIKALRRFQSSDLRNTRYRHLPGFFAARYTDLANLNMHFSNTLQASSIHEIVQNVFAAPGFKKMRAWLFANLHHAMKLGAESTLNFPSYPGDGVALRKRFNDLRKKRQEASGAQGKRILDRLFRADSRGDWHLRSESRESLEMHAFLEAISPDLGLPENFWDTQLQGLNLFEGGDEDMAPRLFDAFVDELVERRPDFRKYIFQTKDSGKGVQLLPGLTAELQNPSVEIPQRELRFKEMENRFPIRSLQKFLGDCSYYLRNLVRPGSKGAASNP